MNNSRLRRAGLYSVLTFLTLIALAIAGAGYLARNIRVNKVERPGGEDVSIRIPGGQFNIRAHENLDPVTLGMPLYPNAKRAEAGKGASFEWSSNDGRENHELSVAGGDYVTSDSVNTVLEWYRGHLPNWVVVTDRDGNNARFELNDGGYKRIIAVRQKGDGTHIGVATVGDPASN